MRAGLTATPKWLPPVWFYDDRGSRLFDEITRLPEYYPTRAERSILDAHAKDIAQLAEADTLVELGAGTCDKSRVLLDAMQSTGAPAALRAPRRERHHPVAGGHRAVRGVPRPGGQRGGRGLPPPPRPAAGRRATPGRLPRRHHRQPRPRPAPRLPHRAGQDHGPERPAAARDRPGQGSDPVWSAPTTTPPG